MKAPVSSLWSMISAAIQAPSSHNTQPWFFELAGNEIALRADRTRGLPVNDPFDRELTISCGAALFNLETAAYVEGYDTEVKTLPDPLDPDLLAVVVLSKVSGMRHSDLSDAIERRASTRGQLAGPPNLLDLHEIGLTLESVAQEHGVFLALDSDRFTIANLVADGDRLQFDDPHWRRELASWLHPRRMGDGMLVPEVLGLANKAVVSLVDLGPSHARADRSLIMNAPILAVFSTVDDQPEDWIETGRALQHVLLTATTMGLMAGFENQPCQVGTLRSKWRALLPNHHYPQLIVRIGIGSEPRHRSVRRPVEEAIHIGDRTS